MKPANTAPSPAAEVERQLRWPLRLTHGALIIEALAIAFWPLLTLVALAAAAVLASVPEALPAPAQRPALWMLGALLGFALLRGLWQLRWPAHGAARAALDASLPGRPISALADQPADGGHNPVTAALWHAHQARMVARAAHAKARPPQPRLARFDRFALRLVALTLFVAGLIFGTLPGGIPGLSQSGSAAAITGPAWEGWITPPAHARLPARYLPDLDAGEISVLQGSEISFRLYGNGLSIDQDVGTLSDDAAAPRVQVTRAGPVAVTGAEGRAWQVVIRPDVSPEIGFAQPPQAGEDGQLTLGFTARDDFGVTEAWAEIRLDLDAIDRRYHRSLPPEPRDAITLPLPLPISGQRVEIAERVVADYSRHAFARLPVTITLFARDATGQTGQSDTVALPLPGRRFFAPMAAAVIEQRQAVQWHRDNTAKATRLLRAVAAYEDGLRSETSRLGLRLVIERMARAAAYTPMSDATQARLADELWRLAEQIEDGELGDALERLRRARERLDQAMRDGASPDEIDSLMREYQEALRDWMEELAQRSEGDTPPMPEQEGMPMTSQDLQDMMDEIQRLMEEGRVGEAMELLDLLQQMLENMQITQGGSGENSAEGLGQTLREQQELSDDAFRDLQQGGEQGGEQPRGPGDGDGQDGAETADELADRQQQLRNNLRGLRDGLPPPGTEEGDAAREALDGAGEAMDRAEDALREGDLGQTLTEQAEAIGQMREALRNMAPADRDSPDRAARAEDQREAREAIDPLGRERNSGRAATGGELGEALDPAERARQLEQLLAERLGRRDLAPQERQYLEDLLERF